MDVCRALCICAVRPSVRRVSVIDLSLGLSLCGAIRFFLHGSNSDDDDGLAVCWQRRQTTTCRLLWMDAHSSSSSSIRATEPICHPLSQAQNPHLCMSGRWGQNKVSVSVCWKLRISLLQNNKLNANFDLN